MLAKSGFAEAVGQRIVLTGGASQLTGLAETARRILGKNVRVGRPLGIQGLPEAAKSPAFAAAVGLVDLSAGGADRAVPRPQPRSRRDDGNRRIFFQGGALVQGQLLRKREMRTEQFRRRWPGLAERRRGPKR